MYFSQLTLTPLEDDRCRLTGRCVITGEQYSVETINSHVEAYQNGALAQDAFPDLGTDDREFLISGTSPQGWKEVFGV